jgi:diguanylate cyclase (GGDEF)-like protein
MGDLQEGLLRARLFRNVPEQLVAAALTGCQTRQLSATETLLRAGTENDILYIIISGQVSVRVPGVDEPHVRLDAGECVGELSILDGQQVSADVVANAPTLVLALDRERLWSLIDSSAEVARNLLGILAGRVRADDVALGESGREHRHLQRLVTVDSLTGLRNRRWLDDAFARQLSRATRASQPLSLLMIDIDRFKQVNDTYGHPAGDAVLRRVAHTLATGLRPQDSLARYGGEEFAVLLPGLGRQQALQVAERLRLTIQANGGDTKRDNVTQITVSIGVAMASVDESLAALVQRADEALYRAKESGRNCTRD